MTRINNDATLTQLRVTVALRINVDVRKPNVGWVERFCDTHHLHVPIMGIAKAVPLTPIATTL